MTLPVTDLEVCVASTPTAVEAQICDRRPDALAVFGELEPDLQRQFAADAWSIGLRALGNARAQAREARLAEIGERLTADLDTKLAHQLGSHQATISASLAKFFDPTDGSVTRRLAEFAADEGTLARLLAKQIGPHGSVLSETLGTLVGDASPLLRRLAADGEDSIVKAIENRLAAAAAVGQRELERAFDPNCEDGAIRRFVVSLRDDLAKADKDRQAQLAAALAALDANDEGSLISRLFRETQQARATMLAAINADNPESPMAAIRASIEGQLARTAARQEQLATEMREAIARLETRRTAQHKSPIGGLAFEDAVAQMVRRTVADGPYLAEATGASVGATPRCKKGDVVIRFTADSAFDGAAVVFEAKREAGYTVRQALEELDAARKNRTACVGVFVMADSHASADFPQFARYGNNVLVRWDDSDPASDTSLRAAVFLGMGLVSRSRHTDDSAGADAITNLVTRLESEVVRAGRMEKHCDNGRRANEGMAEEIRKARSAIEQMVRDTRVALTSLRQDAVDETAECQTPIAFAEPTSAPAPDLAPMTCGPAQG